MGLFTSLNTEFQIPSNLNHQELYDLAKTMFNENKHDISLQLFHKSADMGNLSAQLELGAYYDKLQKDSETAFKFYQLAAQQDNFIGLLWLALYLNNPNNIHYDPKLSLQHLLDIESKGFQDVGLYISQYYKEGIGTEINSPLSKKYLENTAKAGVIDAQFYYGLSLLQGTFDTINISKALDWFQIAASNGQIDAIAQLGLMLIHGIGVQQDIDMGVKALVLSSQQGNSTAQKVLLDFGFDYQKIEILSDVEIKFKKLA